MISILAKEEVIDRWGILISNAEGRSEKIFSDTEQFIGRSGAPDVRVSRRSIAPGLIRGLLGGKRAFLIVSNVSNANLRPYRMYINARDYGSNLDVSWYVVFQPGPGQKLMAFLLCLPIVGLLFLPLYLLGRLTRSRQAGFLGLDIFDEQDLRAFVTNAHHCVLEAVDTLMLDLGQDPSKIDRQSRGFLGIS